MKPSRNYRNSLRCYMLKYCRVRECESIIPVRLKMIYHRGYRENNAN
jgi:hypothetical protein